jgi:glutathione S-transferase
VLTESMIICDYLDEAGAAPRLVGTERWEVMERVGRARGVIDAAFVTVLERRRPAERQSADWIARQAGAIARTLAGTPDPAPGRFDLGDIALACGLGYLDFRLPEAGWRTARPDLAAWFDGVSHRASLQATKP